MSVQQALHFIQQVREEAPLQRTVESLVEKSELGRVVQMGAELGFIFTCADLVLAVKRDWALRWLDLNGPSRRDVYAAEG